MTRCFVIASGIIFAILFLTHVARLFAEGTWILTQPMFIVTSLLSLGMAICATVLVFRRPR